MQAATMAPGKIVNRAVKSAARAFKNKTFSPVVFANKVSGCQPEIIHHEIIKYINTLNDKNNRIKLRRALFESLPCFLRTDDPCNICGSWSDPTGFVQLCKCTVHYYCAAESFSDDTRQTICAKCNVDQLGYILHHVISHVYYPAVGIYLDRNGVILDVTIKQVFKYGTMLQINAALDLISNIKITPQILKLEFFEYFGLHYGRRLGYEMYELCVYLSGDVLKYVADVICNIQVWSFTAVHVDRYKSEYITASLFKILYREKVLYRVLAPCVENQELRQQLIKKYEDQYANANRLTDENYNRLYSYETLEIEMWSAHYKQQWANRTDEHKARLMSMAANMPADIPADIKERRITSYKR